MLNLGCVLRAMYKERLLREISGIIENKLLHISSLFSIVWSIADSNCIPQQCECCALPDELMPHVLFSGAKVMPFICLSKENWMNDK